MIGLLYGLIVFCSGYIGYLISDSYKMKFLYFSELNSLIEKLKVDIGFFQNKVRGVLSGFRCRSLRPTIVAYLNYLDSDRSKPLKSFICNIDFPSEEKEIIESFFDSLGATDVDEQKKILDSYGILFEGFESKRKIAYEKSGKMYFKLSIFIGIGLVVLLL